VCAQATASQSRAGSDSAFRPKGEKPVIVRDLGERWQIVLQTDHADLAAAFARRWSAPVSAPLELVAERHDDGWAVWEQAPRFDEASGKPVNFLEVDVRAHLAFYRAGIAAVTDQDPEAGLLLSMHGAGIYRQRYGLDPGLGLARAAEAQDEVDAFVTEQEAKFGGEPGGRLAEYELLQVFDRLSLYFCMREGEEAEIQGYRLEPVGPWHGRLSPFPFGDGTARFELLRRELPKRDWTEEDFRREFFAQEPERTEITIERG
jgi:uncharacterized protein DUF3891